MRVLGSLLVIGVAAGAAVLAVGVVMDRMEDDRLWHRVKP